MTKTPNGFTIDDALAFIRRATPEERKRLGEVVYSYRSMDIQDTKRELSRGDLVEFSPKKRGYPETIQGKITGINKKTVHVQPTNGGRPWRVQADLVRVVTSATA